MNKPIIFIASSSEALLFTKAVNIRLENFGKIRQWDNAFELSSVTINKLIEKAEDCDYAIFVFHNDDDIIIRENTYSSVRDNVLFELGLFIGKLGLENCFIFAPKNFESNLRLPTDLSGVTISFYDVTDKPLDAVTASCAKAEMAITEIEEKKNKVLEDVNKPEEETKKLINKYLSEIWSNKNKIESLSKRENELENLILNDIMSKLSPATPKEVSKWENGAKEAYMKEIKIRDPRTFYANTDIILPALYGASSISIIVEKGCKVLYSNLGHNSIYYLDGFRMTDR